MAILWYANGTHTNIEGEPGKPIALETLQEYVGGYVEMRIVDDTVLVFNEDGYSMSLPRNAHFPALVGNVIACTLVEAGYQDEDDEDSDEDEDGLEEEYEDEDEEWADDYWDDDDDEYDDHHFFDQEFPNDVDGLGY